MEQQDLSAHLRVEQLQDTLFFPPTDCMAMTTGKKAFRQAQQNGPRNYLYVVAQFQSAELLWLEYLDFLDAVRNAVISKEMIPNTSNCGKGIVWFAINPNSGGFYFKSAEHKARMICAYSALDGLPYELTEEEQTYVPQPGDYVYFRWENVENRVNVSHVGVVAVATQEYIITWEGNASKKVTQRTCFELFCQGCFHIFLQHAGVGNSRNCIPRHMVAHHRFHPAYTQKAEAVDVTSTASACFLINPAAEKLRCCRSCCHGQSRF